MKSLSIHRCISSSFILFVLVIAFILRFVVINQSLWLDEAIGALAVKNFSYARLVTEFLKADNHPPLYYLILKFWTNIFGYSELSLRLPSIIFGTLTVYLAYLIAEKVFKRKEVSLLSAGLIATSQFHIYYSQEARMYSMVGFLACLAIYSYLHILKDSKKRIFWIAYSISVTALVFSDFVPVFFLPFFLVIAVIRKKTKAWWFKFTFSHIPMAIFGILYLPILATQIESGRWLLANFPTWQSIAGGATFKQAVLVWTKFVFGRLSFSNKGLYYSLVVMASIPVIIALIQAFLKRNKEVFLVWLWFLLPLLIGFLTSFVFPAFIYFRFLYVLPAFYLLIAWGVIQIRSKKLSMIVVTFLLLTNILGITIYYFNENTQRENWKEATAFVEDKAKENDIVVFDFSAPVAPYQWYSQGKVKAAGVTDSIYADPERTKEITRNTIGGRRGIYYFEYLRELSDPQDVVRATIRQEGFKETKIYNFPGVGFVYYYTQ